ncbi:MAG TPA: glucose 1-dehydrogenase [Gemmatimonadaceae bacterium]
MRKLEGKVALVTGASRGIGAAIAERLAADGASVVVNYVRAQREAEAVAERVRRAGVRALVAKADVSDPAQAARLVPEAVAQLGRLDIVVNNAVIIDAAPLGDIDPTRVRAGLATNVEGVIATVQAAIAHLPSPGGRVINISSLAATHALAGMTVYTAAKGALDAMTRVWAKELGPRGITVNAVAPGPVDTDAMRENADAAMRAFFVERTPLGRIGVPGDIADIVAFLASQDARWVTGHVLAATGGFTP